MRRQGFANQAATTTHSTTPLIASIVPTCVDVGPSAIAIKCALVFARLGKCGALVHFDQPQQERAHLLAPSALGGRMKCRTNAAAQRRYALRVSMLSPSITMS